LIDKINKWRQYFLLAGDQTFERGFQEELPPLGTGEEGVLAMGQWVFSNVLHATFFGKTAYPWTEFRRDGDSVLEDGVTIPKY